MSLYNYEEAVDMFEKLDVWCDFRNQVMHGLMNKNSDSVNGYLKEQSEEGLKIFRYLDKLVRKIEKVSF
jgi:uroporphyrinogen-III decarboxylase